MHAFFIISFCNDQKPNNYIYVYISFVGNSNLSELSNDLTKKLNKINSCDELTFDDFFTNNFGYEYDIKRNNNNINRFKSLNLSNSTVTIPATTAAAVAAVTVTTSKSNLKINSQRHSALLTSNKMTSRGQHSCSSSDSSSTTSSPSSLTSSGASSPTSPSNIRKNVRELINKAQQQLTTTSSFNTVLPNRLANTNSNNKYTSLANTTSFKHSNNQTVNQVHAVKSYNFNKAKSQSSLNNPIKNINEPSPMINADNAIKSKQQQQQYQQPGTIFKLNNPFIKNNFETIDNSKIILKHANSNSNINRIYKNRHKSSEARTSSNSKL